MNRVLVFIEGREQQRQESWWAPALAAESHQMLNREGGLA